MPSPPNPYRIPKPKTGILWKGSLFTVNEGTLRLTRFDSFSAILTSSHLWLWSELAIPLLTIKSINLLKEGRILSIDFHQALTHQDLVLNLSAHDFFSRADKRKLAILLNELNQAWQAACLQSGEPTFSAALQTLSSEARCEVCGQLPAALLESGYHISFGIAPFFWNDRWKPVCPYVCQRHAIIITCRNNFITSLLGFLGFPGILTGPWYIGKITLRLKKTFPVSILTLGATLLCGLLVPAIASVFLWKWFNSQPP